MNRGAYAVNSGARSTESREEPVVALDQDLARSVQAVGCGRCGGRLDRADYRRKPRGAPAELGAEHALRLSFCCAAGGCRRRASPPSVRFLGRRVYVGAAVVGITALAQGAPRDQLRALLTDNGAAMLAGEVTQGLTRLGIVHKTTLPHSPYQNAK